MCKFADVLMNEIVFCISLFRTHKKIIFYKKEFCNLKFLFEAERNRHL
jgi:hypothetical protein